MNIDDLHLPICEGFNLGFFGANLQEVPQEKVSQEESDAPIVIESKKIFTKSSHDI